MGRKGVKVGGVRGKRGRCRGKRGHAEGKGCWGYGRMRHCGYCCSYFLLDLVEVGVSSLGERLSEYYSIEG